MKKILLTAAAMAVLSTSSAYAMEDMFYVKANAGWSKMDKIKGLKSNNDVFLGLGVGYYVMDNVRTDLTFDHYVKPEHKKGLKKVKGTVNTLMLNGYVDLFDVSVAKMFAGAGFGLAQVEAKVSGDVVNGKAKRKNNLAYAFHLGAATEFAPGVNGELTYSYRDMGKTKKLNTIDYGYKGHHLGLGVRFDI
jgi:opacity protein-like surface antigen